MNTVRIDGHSGDAEAVIDGVKYKREVPVFKVGDFVKVTGKHGDLTRKGEYGRIVVISDSTSAVLPAGVEFAAPRVGHSLHGKTKDGHGRCYSYLDLEKVN